MKNINQASGLSLLNRNSIAEINPAMAGINAGREIGAATRKKGTMNLPAPNQKKQSILKLFKGKMFILYLQAVEIFYIIYS
jgi:hypothetical protein